MRNENINYAMCRLFRRSIAYFAVLGSVVILGVVILLDIQPFFGPAIGAVTGTLLAVILIFRSETIVAPLQVGPENPIDWRLAATSTALYVAGVFISYRFVLHSRPLVHYLLFAGIVGFLAYQIHRGQPREHVLVQLCIVAFTTYWSSQLAFPEGMRSQDTLELLEGFEQVQALGYVTEQATRYAHTPVQPIQAVQYLEILGIEFLTIYLLTTVLMLVATIPLVGLLDRGLPSVSEQTALYAALFFSFMSFTLNRGHIPGKLTIFMPLTMIVILIVLYIIFTNRDRRTWLVIGLIPFAALTFGHDYSAGVTTIVVATLLVFGLVYRLIDILYLSKISTARQFPIIICLVFVLVFITYALDGEGIIFRAIGSIFFDIGSTIFGEGSLLSSSGGTGRYGGLGFELLLFATASETFIFALGIPGLIICIQHARRDLDAVAFWIITGFSLITFSLLIGASHLPPHRIYSLLGMFGLNLTIAITIQLLTTERVLPNWLRESMISGVLVISIVGIFAIFSLASPIAAMPMSPLTTEMPHDRHYETATHTQSVEWIENHGQTEGIIRLHHIRYTEENHLLTMMAPHREMNVVDAGTQTAMIDRGAIDPKSIYMYSKLGKEAGIHAPVDDEETDSGDTPIGGRDFAWLTENPDSEYDDLIYTNGKEMFYDRTDTN